MRKCNLCEWESTTDEPREALKQFAEHLTEHNASPAQWTDAYNSIRRMTEKAKKQDK